MRCSSTSDHAMPRTVEIARRSQFVAESFAA
jgi:hypothetical protein